MSFRVYKFKTDENNLELCIENYSSSHKNVNN